MQNIFAKRRNALLATIDNNAIVWISSAKAMIRNRDVYHPYRQRSYFYYLTGFPEQDAILLLTSLPNQPKFILFCREENPNKINWSIPPIGLKKFV